VIGHAGAELSLNVDLNPPDIWEVSSSTFGSLSYHQVSYAARVICYLGTLVDATQLEPFSMVVVSVSSGICCEQKLSRHSSALQHAVLIKLAALCTRGWQHHSCQHGNLGKCCWQRAVGQMLIHSLRTLLLCASCSACLDGIKNTQAATGTLILRLTAAAAAAAAGHQAVVGLSAHWPVTLSTTNVLYPRMLLLLLLLLLLPGHQAVVGLSAH
jgi:hypothetical protein